AMPSVTPCSAAMRRACTACRAPLDSEPMTPDVLGRFAAATEVIREPEQLRTYECDGLTGHRVVPALVALPVTAEEVQAVVRICNEEGLPFVARGAGTGLSGGALAVAEGIVFVLGRVAGLLGSPGVRS